MPKYMLIVVDDPAREWDDPGAAAEMMGRMGRFASELGDRVQGGSPLTGIADAARLRRVDGQVVVTDGPFAETKEMIAGYFLLEAASREEALELARGCPHLELGVLEVREIIDVGAGPPS